MCVCMCVFQGFSTGGRMRGRVRDIDFCDAVTNSRSLCVEACWWTIHQLPSRGQGEKVRGGDDLILVSVSSERYLVSTS